MIQGSADGLGQVIQVKRLHDELLNPQSFGLHFGNPITNQFYPIDSLLPSLIY